MNKLQYSIDAYLLDNPIKSGIAGCYDEVAKKFNIDKEYVRNRWREIRKKMINKFVDSRETTAYKQVIKELKSQISEDVKTGQANMTCITSKRIKTLEDLIEACEIDTDTWGIVSYEVNKWEIGRKDKEVHFSIEKGVSTGKIDDTGKIFVEPLFQVKVRLSRRRLDNDLLKQKEAILTELKAYSPKVVKYHKIDRLEKQHLLELCTFDLHLGELAWREESEEDYDIKIAEQRFKQSINNLLNRIDLSCVEKILFPLGNDFLNVDNKNNSTSNGTIVDTDCRFGKLIRVARRILIDVIDQLVSIAPVDILVVPGNHDYSVIFTIAEIIDAFYYNNNNVQIFNSLKPRKYYQYGVTGLQLSHGDEEPHQNLGLIFATEEKEMWAATKYRFCQLGHFHKNKKINYVSVDEFQGFQIQILPTLSSSSAWAYKKGYNSLKQAKAFIFDRQEGLIAEYTHTI